MFRQIIRWVMHMAGEDKPGRRLFSKSVVVVLLGLIPTISLAFYSYYKVYTIATELQLERRQALAEALATATNERLDHLQDNILAISTRPDLQVLVADGKWDEASKIVNILKAFSDELVDRILLTDADGVSRVAWPPTPSWIGQNFAYRDWYRGVLATGQPYVSTVYRRVTEPRVSIFAVAAPIWGPNQKLLGMTVFQVRLDALAKWLQLQLGGVGLTVQVYDRAGHVVAHPRLDTDAEPVSAIGLSSFVTELVQGRSGLVYDRDPMDGGPIVVAYQPVPRYHWGLAVTQPTAEAFAERSRSLGLAFRIFAVLTLLNGVWLYLMYLALKRALGPGADNIDSPTVGADGTD